MDFQLSHRNITPAGPRNVPDETIVRMLALTSCRLDRSLHPLLEKWVPDWTVKPTYNSPLHESAVAQSMFADRSGLSGRVSWAIKIAPNGYHFLRIRGLLYNTFHANWSDFSAVEAMHPETVHMVLALTDGIERMCPDHVQEQDRI